MKTRYQVLIVIFLLIDFSLILFTLISGKNIMLFNSKGMIALRERNIIITAVLLAATVVLPVFAALFLIVWKYRATNTSHPYTPEWTGNKKIKALWWTIPTVVIIVLAFIAWKGAHELDPFRPIESTTKPLTIQVVALNWKWLFIYPEQNIATVNFIQIPTQTPITFELTADAPMNSFWIPQLGGQMYAMPGMDTQIHLIANEPGDFPGSEVEINGSGFAGMKFIARATSQTKFENWVDVIKHSSKNLNQKTYEQLAKPSEYVVPSYYATVEKNLYNKIVMKYMMPQPSVSINPINATMSTGQDMQGM